MTELQAILNACHQAHSRHTDSLLATVVHVEGSTYRRPGARKFMSADGHSLGLISGGCLENAVRRKAFWLTTSDGPQLVRYDTSGGDDIALEFALGCQGIVDVLLERLPNSILPPALDFARQSLARRDRCALATVISTTTPHIPVGTRCALDSQGNIISPPQPWHTTILADARAALADTRSRSASYQHDSHTLHIFIECIAPPPHLLILGTGLDAPALAHAAALLGWQVTVIDLRAAFIAPSRYPATARLVSCHPESLLAHITLDSATAALIMTHNINEDRAALRVLAPHRLSYLGILGPRARTDQLLRQLQSEGTPPPTTLLHAPAGLDLGAETPEEIALAIVAEITATLRGHPAGFLRNRPGPIHRPPIGQSALAKNPTQSEAPSCPR